MAYDLYLSFPTIPGESTTPGFVNQIEVYSFSLGFANTVNVSGSGSGAGKASASDVSLMKLYDRASPPLLKALLEGTVLAPKGSNTFVKLSLVPVSGGSSSSKVPLVYSFQDVYITSVSDSGSTGGDSRPTQSFSFAYGIIQESYVPINSDGSYGSAVSVSYNRETNTIS